MKHSNESIKRIIDEIQSKIDIVEFIGEYVKLKKQGSNYVGLCPFHSEKTPSFYVSPTKQVYHCFGCGASGGIVQFLMNIEKVDFKDALKILAKRANIEIPDFIPSDNIDRDVLYAINSETATFFETNLTDEVKFYLKERGLSEEAIKRHRIGFAGNDTKALYNYLLSKGFSKDDILKTGNFKIDQTNNVVSYFYNRIMIPIFDLASNIVAFSGRAFPDGNPKYLNSFDSPIFRKGEILYLMNLAKDDIKEKKEVIIVEGYFDAILLYENGIRNVVSSMGTSFTESQARLLKRFAEVIYFFFDNDLGGRSGAERAIEICNKFGLSPLIVTQAENLDPDELVLKFGSSAIDSLLKTAMDPVFFILNFELSKTNGSINAKNQAIKKVLEAVSKIEDKTVIYEYLKEISKRVEIDERFVIDTFNKINTKNKSQIKEELPPVLKGKLQHIQEFFTQVILQRSEKVNDILSEFSENEFEEPFKKIVLRALDDIRAGKSPNPSSWFDLDQETLNLATEIFLRDEYLVRDEAIDEYLESFRKIKVYEEKLSRLFEEINSENDHERKKSKMQEFNRLIKEFNKSKGR